jgi:predicted dehydrogenase
MTARVRWGILGTASIAMRRVVPAIQASPSGEVAAIASRELATARKAAAAAGISAAHGSYQALLDDPGIDAIYIPLPNHMHLPWTIRALESGKHVLCEKPLALSADEVRALDRITKRFTGLKVMEAFMYRFQPRWQAIHALIKDGTLGDLATVHAVFGYHNTNPADIRNQPEAGGGALLDIGCYGVSVARWLFGREPKTVQGSVQRDPGFGTDRLTSGLLDFDPGTATFTCATQLPWQQHVSIIGSAGRIEVERPFSPLADQPAAFRCFVGDDVEEAVFPASDQYTLMVAAFERAIVQDTAVPIPLDDSLANMTVLDAVAHGGMPGSN